MKVNDGSENSRERERERERERKKKKDHLRINADKLRSLMQTLCQPTRFKPLGSLPLQMNVLTGREEDEGGKGTKEGRGRRREGDEEGRGRRESTRWVEMNGEKEGNAREEDEWEEAEG